MVRILDTEGLDRPLTIEELRSYDVIRYSAALPHLSPNVRITDAGEIDFLNALQGQRGISVRASDAGNTITGGTQDDSLFGGRGSDRLDGGDGSDQLSATVSGRDGVRDFLSGGDGDDTLRGGSSADILYGGRGDDTISVSYDPVAVATGKRGSVIDGGEGDDSLTIESGASRYAADISDMTIRRIETLFTSNQTITATVAQLQSFKHIVTGYNGPEQADYFPSDTISLALSDGGEVNLTRALYAQADVPWLSSDRGVSIHASAAGNDITGGRKGDTFYSGAGNDRFDGGAGRDAVVYAGKFADYRVAKQSDGSFAVTGDGQDKLVNIEAVWFKDGFYDLSTGRFKSSTLGEAPTLSLKSASVDTFGNTTYLYLGGNSLPGQALEFVVESSSNTQPQSYGAVVAGAGGQFSKTLQLSSWWDEVDLKAFDLYVRPVGSSGHESSKLVVVQGSADAVRDHLSDYVGDSDLSAVLIVGNGSLNFASRAQMDAARTDYASVLGKIVGGYTLSVTASDGSQWLKFGADNKLLAEEHYYADKTLAYSLLNKADGTSEAHNYDTAGRETGRITTASDGAHDVFEFVYRGAAKVPASQTQTHYGTDDVKLWVDQTAANGSHTQVATAAGAVMVSHAKVADTFTGFHGGSDAFVFAAGFGKDVVKGFEVGSGVVHDVLRIDDSLVSNFADFQAHLTHVGSDTLVSFGSDTILLKGIAPEALTAGNVQFVHHDLLQA